FPFHGGLGFRRLLELLIHLFRDLFLGLRVGCRFGQGGFGGRLFRLLRLGRRRGLRFHSAYRRLLLPHVGKLRADLLSALLEQGQVVEHGFYCDRDGGRRGRFLGLGVGGPAARQDQQREECDQDSRAAEDSENDFARAECALVPVAAIGAARHVTSRRLARPVGRPTVG